MSHLDWDENIPKPDEYADYHQKYIDLVTGPNVIQQLIKQGQQVYTLFKQLDEEKANYKYAKGKWSVKEVLGHLIDTERIMAYRALCLSRREQQSLPNFNQENYVRNSYFSERIIQSMASEYDAQRNANISLFNSFNNRQITCGGTISGDHMTVRALVFMTAGHERHHLGTLEKRYGVSL